MSVEFVEDAGDEMNLLSNKTLECGTVVVNANHSAVFNFHAEFFECAKTLNKATSESSNKLSMEGLDLGNVGSNSSLDIDKSVFLSCNKFGLVSFNFVAIEVTVWVVTSGKIELESVEPLSMDMIDFSNESSGV